MMDTRAENKPCSHILIVDDDKKIRQLLAKYLVQNGFRVTHAENAKQAHIHMKGLIFDIIILDVMMPQETGLQFAQNIKKNTPIIFLSALNQTEHRIEGLQSGADDYMVKPFEPKELLLRINAVLRRTKTKKQNRINRFGPYKFNSEKLELTKENNPVHLTIQEKTLLAKLAQNAGKAVPRTDFKVNQRGADVIVNRIRQKIEENPSNPVYLKTVHGIGYILIND